MTDTRKYPTLSDLGVILVVAGIYFLAAKLGLSLAVLNASVSPVWPPTGVAIALVFWLGYRSALGVLLGALIGNYFLTDLGASFTIRIPLAAMQSEESAAREAEQLEREKTATVRQPLEGLRVLVVEDEPDARELLSLTLEGSGAEVEAVESAQEALTNLQLFKPDVLLSDIGLPIESGYDLIRKIRSLPSEASNIPAVALTAFATEKDRQLALTAGFQVHLAKPVEPSELVAAIERLAMPDPDSNKP